MSNSVMVIGKTETVTLSDDLNQVVLMFRDDIAAGSPGPPDRRTDIIWGCGRLLVSSLTEKVAKTNGRSWEERERLA